MFDPSPKKIMIGGVMILGGKESPTPDQHTLTNIPILECIIYKPLRDLYIITLRSGGYLAKSRLVPFDEVAENKGFPGTKPRKARNSLDFAFLA